MPAHLLIRLVTHLQNLGKGTKKFLNNCLYFNIQRVEITKKKLESYFFILIVHNYSEKIYTFAVDYY